MVHLFFSIFLLSFSPAAFEKPDCEVIEYLTNVEVIGGRLHITRSDLIQVNNVDGEVFNPLYIFYSEKDNITELQVQLETVDGKVIRVFNRKDFEEESAISRSSYNEYDLVKKVIITHNQYPYRIRYHYKKEIRDFLTLGRWMPQLRSSVPSKYSKLNIAVPSGYPINIYESKIQHVKSFGTEGRVSYHWEANNTEKFEEEELGSHPRDILPYVMVIPESFNVRVYGELTSWESYGNWICDLNEGSYDLSDAEPKQDQQVKAQRHEIKMKPLKERRKVNRKISS